MTFSDMNLMGPIDVKLLASHNVLYQIGHLISMRRIFFVNNTNEWLIVKAGEHTLVPIQPKERDGFWIEKNTVEIVIGRHAPNVPANAMNLYEIIAEGVVNTTNGMIFTIHQEYVDEKYLTRTEM